MQAETTQNGTRRASQRKRTKGRLAVKEVATRSRKWSPSTSGSLQVLDADEIGPLQVVDQRMIGRKAAGRLAKRAALQLEAFAETFATQSPPPAVRPVDNRLPNLA